MSFKKIIIGLIVLNCFGFSMGQSVATKNVAAPAPSEKTLDYAAIVNGDKILMPEFNRAVQNAKENLLQQGTIDFKTEEGQFILTTTQRSILDDMVNQTLIKQQAAKMNIEVSDKDIKNEISSLRRGFPSEKMFEDTLAEENINKAELEQGIKGRVVIAKIKKALTAKISISDRDVNNFLKQNKELMTQPRRMQFKQIVCASKGDAEKVLDRLKGGEQFSVLAKEFSIDMMSRDAGGNIGFIEPGTMNPEIERNLFIMKEGEISPILESEEGYAIYKCSQIIDQTEEDLKQSTEEAKKYLINKKETEIFEKWFNKVKAESKIEINPAAVQEIPSELNEKQKAVPGNTISNNDRV